MILEVKNIVKSYKDKIAVDNLNLEIEEGSFTAILGPNGAGKSTTIKMLMGLLEPTSGIIKYKKGVKLGVVFQGSVLDDLLTVKENLYIRVKQYRNSDVKNVDKLINELGLKNFENQKYGTLSGGQKRRVDIARSLLSNPDILFLDEPTTGLDIQTRVSIWKLLFRLQKEKGMTVILTTHYLDEADEADMIYIVDQGKVIAKGSAYDIKINYANNILEIKSKNIEKFRVNLNEEGYKYKITDDNKFVLTTKTSDETIELLNKYKEYIYEFEFRKGSINDAFINLTGKEVR